MSFKRLVLGITCLLLCLGWTVTAQSKQYSLSQASGLQLQIGGGLPLPIQVQQYTAGGNPTNIGTNFPPLLVPKRNGPVTVSGTTAMTVQQKLVVPPLALVKQPSQNTVGQFGQNPTLYAVGTNLYWAWPTATATFSTGARTGVKTTTFTTPSPQGTVPSKIRYSNPLTAKFGGPGIIAIVPQGGTGVFPQVGVTIYGIAVKGPGNPPCTHTKIGGLNPACVAGLAHALPGPIAAVGAQVSAFGSTPGGAPTALLPPTTMTSTAATGTNGPGPFGGVGIGKFLANGTPALFIQLAGSKNPPGTNAAVSNPPGTSPTIRRGFTNMASSWGYPWTTGMLTISAGGAYGVPETFKITGKDLRTPKGSGTIQMVAGSLSKRALSGPNANRGWVRLVLTKFNNVPALSPGMRVAAAVLMLLAFGYAVRRRFSA